MKRTETRIWTLVLGIVAAMAVVFFQLFYFQTAGHARLAKKEVKTEQKEDHADDETCFTLPSSSLPSSAHVHLNTDVFFLFEVLLAEDQHEERHVPVASPLKKIFSTLLGSFISPNAP